MSNGNKWINIKCVGTVTNKSAIGAKVRLKAIINGNPVWQMQEIDGQSGYCGQNLILHFGLGQASVIDSIKVEWPAGGDQYFTNVPLNRNVTITENGKIISINEKKINADMNYILNQNFPNPFNPNTVISYQIFVSTNVFINVYDVLGKNVVTLINN